MPIILVTIILSTVTKEVMKDYFSHDDFINRDKRCDEMILSIVTKDVMKECFSHVFCEIVTIQYFLMTFSHEFD